MDLLALAYFSYDIMYAIEIKYILRTHFPRLLFCKLTRNVKKSAGDVLFSRLMELALA